MWKFKSVENTTCWLKSLRMSRGSQLSFFHPVVGFFFFFFGNTGEDLSEFVLLYWHNKRNIYLQGCFSRTQCLADQWGWEMCDHRLILKLIDNYRHSFSFKDKCIGKGQFSGGTVTLMAGWEKFRHLFFLLLNLFLRIEFYMKIRKMYSFLNVWLKSNERKSHLWPTIMYI